jgi:hypothetical protein
MNSKSKKVQTVTSDGRTQYQSKYESIRHLLTAVVYCAARDAAGILESSSYSRLEDRRALTIHDGARFFVDGRFRWFADVLDLEPDMLPVAWAVMEPALDEPARCQWSDMGDLLNHQHNLAMKRNGGK